ncbi:MAG: P-loop NTPase [Candidatus Promineifilaceae bacterium]|jgi:CO dehydrogenase nickel-insertion accessory protein CooC1
MLTEEQELSGKRIGIFGKGGSGKSTVAVLLAKALRKAGYEVCVLDADSTNIGLSKALGIESPPVPLLDYFGGMVFSGGAVTCPVDDPTPLADADIDIEDLPSEYCGRSPEGIQFFMAGKMGDKGPGAGCDGPIAKIARDFNPHFEGQQPVTLVDFKAGFEDSARGNIISLDWIVVVVDPTIAAVQMAINMKEMVDQLKAGGLPATAHLEYPELIELAYQMYRDANVKGVLFVLNKVRDDLTEQFLRDKLAKNGIKPLGVIHDTPALSMAWLMGEPLIKTSAQREAELIVQAIETIDNVYTDSEGEVHNLRVAY